MLFECCSKRPLKPYSLFFLFTSLLLFFFSDRVISIILSSELLIHSSVSPYLLMIPSSIFFISVTIFFCSKLIFLIYFVILCWSSVFFNSFPWFGDNHALFFSSVWHIITYIFSLSLSLDSLCLYKTNKTITYSFFETCPYLGASLYSLHVPIGCGGRTGFEMTVG